MAKAEEVRWKQCRSSLLQVLNTHPATPELKKCVGWECLSALLGAAEPGRELASLSHFIFLFAAVVGCCQDRDVPNGRSCFSSGYSFLPDYHFL